jgi:RHS repeat-associated protein
VKVETRTDLSSTVPRRKVEFMYDYRGRRIQKRVSGWTGSSWSHSAERRFIWVDWMLVAETDENRNIVRSYLWGLDLAEQTAPQQATPHRNFLGSKAGGVGGLVAMSKHGPTIYTYPVSSDANGNVVAVGTDTIFEYDAFGKTVRATGPLVDDMPFRFSTKFHDGESGLYYYGYRYYSPGMGRFLNRDPIGEKGGSNLYAMVNNKPVNRIDRLGLHPFPDLEDDNPFLPWFPNCGEQKARMLNELRKACDRIRNCKSCGVQKHHFSEVKRLCENPGEIEIDCQTQNDSICNKDSGPCGYMDQHTRRRVVICNRGVLGTDNCGDSFCTIAHEIFHAAQYNARQEGERLDMNDANTLEKCIGCPGGGDHPRRYDPPL